MKISVLIPCHNEEKSIQTCVQSCLDQSRIPDEIVVVNDGSTDRSAEILAGFGDQIKVVTLEKATGNKSFAQEYGLRFVSGEIFITTDGDTVLDRDFVKIVEEDFTRNPQISAIAGYVRSRKYNWLTACRAFEYAIGRLWKDTGSIHIRKSSKRLWWAPKHPLGGRAEPSPEKSGGRYA